MTGQLERLAAVVARLRKECPWDAEQTHRSLVKHLIEETSELVDAIEIGNDADLQEELGDVLLQVYFHAQIAADDDRFNIEDVAAGIADKLIRRHPHVFAGEEVPENLRDVWEARKRQEKGRTSSLDGIAESMSSVARAQKVVSRARSHQVAIELAQKPISAEELGEQVIGLVARAQANGIDADAAIRDALRQLEGQILTTEQHH